MEGNSQNLNNSQGISDAEVVENLNKASGKKPEMSLSIRTMPLKFVDEGDGGSKKMLFIVGGTLGFLILGIVITLVVLNQNINQQKIVERPEPSTPVKEEQKVEETPVIEEESEPEVIEEPEPEVVQEPDFVVEFVSSKDADQDGLTDAEELIYNTFPSRPDSDGDGHIDSLELLSFFNPTRVAPSDLVDSGLINTFESFKFGFLMFYPISWNVNATDPAGRVVEFSTQTDEKILVEVEDNPQGLSISEWILENKPETDLSELQTFTLQSGLRGIKTDNGLHVHLVKPSSASILDEENEKKVYSFKYVPGNSVELNYQTTFEMMQRSFSLVENKEEDEIKIESTAGLGNVQNLQIGEEDNN